MRSLLHLLVVITLCSTLFVSRAYSQWTQVGEPYGGCAQSITYNNDYWFVSLIGNGIYRSADEGQHWENVSEGLTSNNYTGISAIGSNLYATSSDNGTMISHDNGDTWTRFDKKKEVTGASAYLLSNDTIYVATSLYIYRTKIGDDNWQNLTYGSQTSNFTSITQLDKTIFVGNKGLGVLKGGNDNLAWDQSNIGLKNLNVLSLIAHEGNLYAGTTGGVYISTDKAFSWSATNTSMAGFSISSFAYVGSNLYAATTAGGVYATNDQGATWTAVNTGLEMKDIITLTSIGSKLVAGTNGFGVYVSNDERDEWSKRSDDLLGTRAAFFEILDDKFIVGTKESGVFEFDNQSPELGWQPMNKGITNYNIRTLKNIDNELFVTNDVGLYRYDTVNQAWINSKIASTKLTFALEKVDSVLVAGQYGDYVFRSLNNGTSWTKSSTGLANKNVSALAVIDNDIFAGTYGGGVFRSSDLGATWESKSTAAYNKNVNVLTVRGSKLYTGTDSGLSVSDDKGDTWQYLTEYPISYVYDIAFKDSITFIGTYSGVYFCMNDSSDWIKINDGLIQPIVSLVSVVGDTLYSGGTYSGLWKRSVAEVLSSYTALPRINSPENIDLGIYTLINKIRITYNLLSSSSVNLSIVDIYGREIYHSAQTDILAGRQLKELSTNGLAKGVYICRLQINDKYYNKKFIIE